MTPLRVALVSCSSQKAGTAQPAHNLYTSPLFRAQFEEAHRQHGNRVLILSALHGAVDPRTRLAPYDFTMGEYEPWERAEWGHVVLCQVRDWLESLWLLADCVELHVYAGRLYVEPLCWQLPEWQGWTVVEPLAGLQVGQRLQRLKQAREAA